VRSCVMLVMTHVILISMLSVLINLSYLFTQLFLFFFFNDTATTEIYTLSLHDALPIYRVVPPPPGRKSRGYFPAYNRGGASRLWSAYAGRPIRRRGLRLPGGEAYAWT